VTDEPVKYAIVPSLDAHTGVNLTEPDCVNFVEKTGSLDDRNTFATYVPVTGLRPTWYCDAENIVLYQPPEISVCRVNVKQSLPVIDCEPLKMFAGTFEA
jgi:hypothetical protein